MPRILAKTLDFHTQTEMRPVDNWGDALPQGVPALGACVSTVPLVNGKPLFYTNVFDTFALIAQWRLQKDHEADLLTCSCGVAGCAGLFDSAYIKSTKAKVQWYLPPDYRIGEGFGIEHEPLSESQTQSGQDTRKWTLVEFKREVYAKAMQALEKQLGELASENDGFLWLAPQYPQVYGNSAEQCRFDLDESIERVRVHRDNLEESAQDFDEAFGEFANPKFQWSLPEEGVALSVNAHEVLCILANKDYAQKHNVKDIPLYALENEDIEQFREQGQWTLEKALEALPGLIQTTCLPFALVRLPDATDKHAEAESWLEKALECAPHANEQSTRLIELLCKTPPTIEPGYIPSSWTKPKL